MSPSIEFRPYSNDTRERITLDVSESGFLQLLALGTELADEKRREEEKRDEWYRTWSRVPRERRESLLLEVLGNDQLTTREITGRLNAELDPGWVYESNVRSLVSRMVRAGQLEREAEPFHNSKVRYRYSRKRALEGPITDLERAYHEGADA